MTTVDTHVPGRVCWVELSTTDLAGGRSFYADLFGWKEIAESIEGWGEYVTFTVADGRGAAGAYEQQEQERSMGVPPHWNLYLYADDVDKTVARAAEAGATVMVPGLDTPHGRMAVLADPTGAPFCLWQSDEMPGFKVRDEPASFSWPELLTREPDRAVTFYGDVFGWTANTVPMGQGRSYTILHHQDKDIAGLFEPPSPEVPNSWLVYFDVTDAAATVADAEDGGGGVMQAPMAIPEVGT